MIYGATRKTADGITTLLESRHIDPKSSSPDTVMVRGKDTILVQLDEDLVSPASTNVAFTKAWGKVLRYDPSKGRSTKVTGRILVYNPWVDYSYVRGYYVQAQRSSNNVLIPNDPTGRPGIFTTVSAFINGTAFCVPSVASGLVTTGHAAGAGYQVHDHLGIFTAAPVGTKLLAQWLNGMWVCFQMECLV